MNNLGERIKKARLNAMLSQEELGKMIHISTAQIGYYESERSEPSASMLYSIAKALKKPISYFYGEDEELIQNEIVLKLNRITILLNDLTQQVNEYSNNHNYKHDIISQDNERQRVPKKQFRTTRTVNGINIEVMQDNHGDIVYVNGREKEEVK